MNYKGVLEITVIEAKNLVAADKTGTSDPYCVLSLEKQRRKTKFVDKTLNPVWNETLLFYTKGDQWDRDLKLSVFDHDSFSVHDSIGECTIKSHNIPKGETEAHWISLQKVKQGQVHIAIAFRPLGENETVDIAHEDEENDTELGKAKERGETYWPLKGSVYPPTNYSPSRNAKRPPSQTLELEFVYGYRGYDCRDNLHFNKDGHLIFNSAALGVVFDPQTRNQTFYTRHDDDVVSLAVHTDGEIAATGQVASLRSKKPRILVWNTTTRETVQEISGFHDRSVCALAFSKTGDLLASVGTDDHNSVAIYNWKTGALLASSYGSSSKTLAIKFFPDDNSSFVTCGVKHLKFWNYNAETGKLTARDGVFKTYPVQTILSVDFIPGGEGSEPTVITGTYGGDVLFWKNREVAKAVKLQEGPVYSARFGPFGIAAGGKDGKVYIFGPDADAAETSFDIDARTDAALKEGLTTVIRCIQWKEGQLVVGTNESEVHRIDLGTKEIAPLLRGHFGDVYGFAPHPSYSQFITTGKDKTVRLWDITSKTLVKAVETEVDPVCAGFSPDGHAVAVGLESGVVLILDPNSLAVSHQIKEKKVKINVVSFSPDGSLLAVGAHDGTIEIFNAQKNYAKISTFKGHTSYVSHLDWSDDSKVVQSDSGSYEHLYWDVEDGEQITRSTAVRNCLWDTYTCILGWHVMGIWPKGADGSDINALCRARGSDIVATADDSGKVKLFRYPCHQGSPFREYSGHSSHVMNVGFTKNDTHLISCGGQDRAIFQWKFSGSSGLAESAPVDEPPVSEDQPIVASDGNGAATEETERVRRQLKDEAEQLRRQLNHALGKVSSLSKEKEAAEQKVKQLESDLDRARTQQTAAPVKNKEVSDRSDQSNGQIAELLQKITTLQLAVEQTKSVHDAVADLKSAVDQGFSSLEKLIEIRPQTPVKISKEEVGPENGTKSEVKDTAAASPAKTTEPKTTAQDKPKVVQKPGTAGSAPAISPKSKITKETPAKAPVKAVPKPATKAPVKKTAPVK
eukprot:TRINITY_DN1680_c0_g1_i2.p1 TRINITY_DN1680_c0_g1~~TRINITY_DN1680_c0_g1_i2.p1  ORF type:complete len:1023 (-),score=268.98 TRINITY_DN1680_c0_g1_i2:52-3120(-)